jgi:RNA polymerase sigma factor (sigma-70 family)
MVPMSEPRVNASFPTTRWSQVLHAGKRDQPESEQALAGLCMAYWPAVYAFVRRQVSDIHEAQDLTQSFFAHLLEKNAVAFAEPTRGRFRSFLLASARNFLSNEWDKQKRLKRGGADKILPLDFEREDSTTHTREPIDAMTPDRIYERQWALGLLDLVLARLRAEYTKAGKERIFEGLKGALSGTAETSSPRTSSSTRRDASRSPTSGWPSCSARPRPKSR